jgi:PAS domain S-box-containing protein
MESTGLRLEAIPSAAPARADDRRCRENRPMSRGQPPEQAVQPSLLDLGAGSSDHQRMLALLFRSTAQGLWIIDNALRTTDANPAMCRMLGLSREQLLGRDIFSFVDDANAEVFREHVRLRAQGMADSYEITLRRADGQPVHCWNNATPIVDAEGRKIGAMGMFSDITALKQAQERARHLNEQLEHKSLVLETTLNSLRQGVLRFDPDGRVNAWNARLLELVQLPAALLEARPTQAELIAWQVRHGHYTAEQCAAFLQGQRERVSHYRRERPDGVVLDVETHHADDGSLVRTFTDVTAAVRAEQALRDSEQRFRTMADAAPALVWESDAEGRQAWFNQRWLGVTGRTLAEELALPWSARIHPDDVAHCRAVFDAALAARRPYRLEFRVPRQGGGWWQVEDNGIPRIGAGGRFDGFVSYGWDITERKAAEAALIAAKDEAERANRAKSEFLSRMSHELRTPLNAVLGFAQLMRADADDPLSTPQQRRLRELERGARHLLVLINDVLDLARIEAGALALAPGAVDVAALAAECLPLVQPAADARGLALTVRPPAGPVPAASADPVRLKQVVLNLLSNAVKYTPAGGAVWLGWSAAGDGVRLEVGDTGPGLAPQEQERLFQPFERLQAAHSTVDGAGIGLALSKWLVNLMHGELGVDSAPGSGSVFWVRMRAAGAPQAAAAEPAMSRPMDLPAADGRRDGTRRVLYIEDNDVNRLLMQGMLAHSPGVELQLAELPEQGLALAAAAPPQLVLLDIQLPGMDGYEVLRRLRRLPGMAGVPVIAISANAMPADRERAAAAGFDDYITKPVDLPQLLRTLERHWRG